MTELKNLFDKKKKVKALTIFIPGVVFLMKQYVYYVQQFLMLLQLSESIN